MSEHDTYHSPTASPRDAELLLSASTTPLQEKIIRNSKQPNANKTDPPAQHPLPAEAVPTGAAAPASGGAGGGEEEGHAAFNLSLEQLQAELLLSSPPAVPPPVGLAIFNWPGALRERVDAPGVLYNMALVYAASGRPGPALRALRRSQALLSAAQAAPDARSELRAALIRRLTAAPAAPDAPAAAPVPPCRGDLFNERLEEEEAAAGGARLSVFAWPGALRERVDAAGLLFNKALLHEAYGDHEGALAACDKSRAWLGVPTQGRGAAPGGAGEEAGALGGRARCREALAGRLREGLWGAA